MTLDELKKRARKHDMEIRKYRRGEDFYMLVDIRGNFVAAPEPMTLEQVALWLADLDELNAEAEDKAEAD